MACYSTLKGWRNEETGGIQFRADGAREKMEVACGQCIGCRTDIASMWSVRIVHESCLHEATGGNCFITLTYRDRLECDGEQLRNGYHIPDDWSLSKKHCQDFLKRLRHHFKPRKIRFYLAGEYGNKCKHGIEVDKVKCPLCRIGRPHYHACLFNCTFSDLEPYASSGGRTLYTSGLLESIWKFGFVDVGQLTPESAAYVARYAMKKVTGVRAHDHYMLYDVDGCITFVTPEFCLMSRGHTCIRHRGMPYQIDCPKCSRGIGRDWYERHKSDFFPSDQCPVVGGGVYHGVPRFYEELFKIEDPLTLEDIKEVRQEFMRKHADDYTPDRLMDRYEVHKARNKLLLRSL